MDVLQEWLRGISSNKVAQLMFGWLGLRLSH
jgi:hypothetical protein